MAEFSVVAAMAIVTVYARPMIAKLADVSGWVTIVAALAALIFGTFLGALVNLADRLHGRRARRGDLAAVGIRHGQWFRGQMPIPVTQVGPGTFVDSTDGVGFPMAVVNGSGEKKSPTSSLGSAGATVTNWQPDSPACCCLTRRRT